MRLQLFTFFTAFTLFSSALLSQERLPKFITDSLDTYLREQQTQWKIPALAVAIIKDGKVVKTYTNGVTDYTSNTPIDENTLFMIGSNSKAFTTTLVATLAEEKQFSLKDPVKKWLPYFKLYDDYLTENVNIIDVLSHRVGFETFQGDFLNFDNELTSEEIIRKFALIKPAYTFREKWGYFNTGYTIAGEIIKRTTGKTWAVQIQERIFDPLGMEHSLALSKDILTAQNRTKPHTLIDGELVEIAYGDIDATAPAGSISSSLSDMSTWVMTLLANGKHNGEQIIPVAAISATRKPRIVRGSAKYPFSMYGLGWNIQATGDEKLIMHTGGIHGYVSSVTMVPAEQLGVVILTNTDSNYLYEGMKYDIINSFLDNPVYGVSKRYFEYFERNKVEEEEQKKSWLTILEEKNEPSVPLETFTGKYVNEVYGWLEIKKGTDGLEISFEHHKDLSVTLSHLKDDEFLASFSIPSYGESVFPFEVEQGSVKKFTLKLAPRVEQTTYDFYKD